MVIGKRRLGKIIYQKREVSAEMPSSYQVRARERFRDWVELEGEQNSVTFSIAILPDI